VRNKAIFTAAHLDLGTSCSFGSARAFNGAWRAKRQSSGRAGRSMIREARRKLITARGTAFSRNSVVVSDPSGINRVRYQAVAAVDFKSLQDYLRSMQAVAISNYNRNEQKAFWINVYNALTIDVVLSRFPVVSIRTINISPELLSQGPWARNYLSSKAKSFRSMTSSIESSGPIWKDNRVHYAVNAATLGSPNLQPLAFTSETAKPCWKRARANSSTTGAA